MLLTIAMATSLANAVIIPGGGDYRRPVEYNPPDGMLIYMHACTLPLFSIIYTCLLYTSPSPRDATLSRMPSSA